MPHSMDESDDAARFDSAAEAFLSYLESPHGRLRSRLIQTRLRRWLRARWPLGSREDGLTVLDVGAGSGSLGLVLAREEGARVALVEPSATLVERLEARVDSLPVRVHRASLERLSEHIGSDVFDLVICHDVIEYLADECQALAALAGRVAPGGALSVVAFNPRQEPLRRAVRDRDLAGAIAALAANLRVPSLYGVDRKGMTVTQLTEGVEVAGLTVERLSGVFVCADYLDSERIDREFDAALKLDLHLGDQPDCVSVSRYLHTWATRMG